MFMLSPDRLRSVSSTSSAELASPAGTPAWPPTEAGIGTSSTTGGHRPPRRLPRPRRRAVTGRHRRRAQRPHSYERAPATSRHEQLGGGNTTGGLSGCGDGVVDATEECDDGAAGNDDTRFCKEDCTLNVCGDGKLFVGWELCDQGPGNSDAYGSLCGSQCTPGARCGDNKLQPEFETCDLGINNGGEKGDEQGILCDTSCRAQQLRGFVTRRRSRNLGGLFGADLKCRDARSGGGARRARALPCAPQHRDVDAKSASRTSRPRCPTCW
jgi:hypothetical protein